MTEQPLDLRRALAILRRHRTILILVGVLGLLAGIGLSVLRPVLPTATAVVLLPPPPVSSTGTSQRDMDTQIRIATSQQILTDAGKKVTPPMGFKAVRKHVVVTAPTTDLLSVRAKASSATDAKALANGVANGYVSYTNGQANGAAAVLIKNLKGQQATIEQQISTLQGQIQATTQRIQNEGLTSTAGTNDTQVLQSQKERLGNLTLQRNTILNEIATAGISTGQGLPGASVFQAANTTTHGSLIRHRGVYGTIGFLLALVLGATVILMISRRGRRPRLRDEIAEGVGAPVLASISARRPKPSAQPDALGRAFEPDVMDAWSIRKTLEEIGAFDPSRDQRVCLSFITLDDDNEALGVGPQFALFLSSHGVSTSLETAISEDWAIQLRAMLTLEGRSDALNGNRPGLLGPDDEEGRRATVALSAVDRHQPRFAHPVDPSTTILVLSPGSATSTDLARVALAAIDSGQRIDGVIVANPEPGDRTIGRLTQPKIGPQAPRPNRLTGTTEGKWR